MWMVIIVFFCTAILAAILLWNHPISEKYREKYRLLGGKWGYQNLDTLEKMQEKISTQLGKIVSQGQPRFARYDLTLGPNQPKSKYLDSLYKDIYEPRQKWDWDRYIKYNRRRRKHDDSDGDDNPE